MADFTDKIPFNLGQGFGLLGSALQMFGAQASYSATKANATIIEQQGILENEIAKANAEAIEMQAEYNANVQRNNAFAQAQQKYHENSVIQANRLLLIQRTELAQQKLQRDLRTKKAETLVRNPRLSQDVINSIEVDAFSEQADLDLEYNAQLQEMGAMVDENTRQAALQSLYGGAQALSTLQAGRNNAFFTRQSGRNALSSSKLRAGQTRIKGKAERLGNFTSALTSGASYFIE